MISAKLRDQRNSRRAGHFKSTSSAWHPLAARSPVLISRLKQAQIWQRDRKKSHQSTIVI